MKLVVRESARLYRNDRRMGSVLNKNRHIVEWNLHKLL